MLRVHYFAASSSPTKTVLLATFPTLNFAKQSLRRWFCCCFGCCQLALLNIRRHIILSHWHTTCQVSILVAVIVCYFFACLEQLSSTPLLLCLSVVGIVRCSCCCTFCSTWVESWFWLRIYLSPCTNIELCFPLGCSRSFISLIREAADTTKRQQQDQQVLQLAEFVILPLCYRKGIGSGPKLAQLTRTRTAAAAAAALEVDLHRAVSRKDA